MSVVYVSLLCVCDRGARERSSIDTSKIEKQEIVFSLSPLTAAGGVCALPSPLGIYSGIPLVFILNI